MKKLPIYKISINQELAENGEELGIQMIANTATPAIMVKGVAFEESSKILQQKFSDELKMRVAAPILIPDVPIYRFDEEIGEYEVVFDSETIQQLVYKFKKELPKKPFNIDHDKNSENPSFLLNDWFVENPETDISYIKFGIKVPKNTWFGVQQFTDKEYFKKEIIEKDRTGFSIEGFLALVINEIKQKYNNQKLNNKNNMEKLKFEMLKLADGTPVYVSKLEKNAEVFIINDELEKTLINDGEHELENGVKFTTKDGKIETLEEKAEDVKMEEPVAEPTKEEPVAEPTKEEPVAEPVVADEERVLAIVQPKLDEIYSQIAELKTLIETKETEDDVVVDDNEMSAEQRFNLMVEKFKSQIL